MALQKNGHQGMSILGRNSYIFRPGLKILVGKKNAALEKRDLPILSSNLVVLNTGINLNIDATRSRRIVAIIRTECKADLAPIRKTARNSEIAIRDLNQVMRAIIEGLETLLLCGFARDIWRGVAFQSFRELGLPSVALADKSVKGEQNAFTKAPIPRIYQELLMVFLDFPFGCGSVTPQSHANLSRGPEKALFELVFELAGDFFHTD